MKKLWKTVKFMKKNIKKTCFRTVFQILCNLDSILAHQTSKSQFDRSWRIFWHPWDPWDPWGHINSGDIRVLRVVLIFQHISSIRGIFFHSSQIKARCHIDLTRIKVIISFIVAIHNCWIFKVIQAVSVFDLNGSWANKSSVPILPQVPTALVT